MNTSEDEGRRRVRIGFALEVMFVLGWTRLLCLLPMTGWMKLARLQRLDTAAPTVPSMLDLREVQRHLRGVARRVPWRSDCLPRGLAAMILIGRRGGHPVLHLGARRLPTTDGKAMEAHAWVVCDEFVVCGGPQHRDYASLLQLSFKAATTP